MARLLHDRNRQKKFTGSVIEKWELGYIIKVENFTDCGQLATQLSLAIGETLEVVYVSDWGGKPFFAATRLKEEVES